MIVLGLIETALELIPKEIVTNPLIVASARDRGKPPEQILLDEALHAKALQMLPDAEKRGRPDIAHRSIITALDSVYAQEGQLEVFVHTYPGQIIRITPGTRIPRRTPRFIGLIEQLLFTHRVPVTGPPLLEIHPGTLKGYLHELQPSTTVLLAQEGTPTPPTQLAQALLAETKPVVLVGGFPHGAPSPHITHLVDQQVSFDPQPLPTSTVVGMLIHSLENASNITTQRFRQTS